MVSRRESVGSLLDTEPTSPLNPTLKSTDKRTPAKNADKKHQIAQFLMQQYHSPIPSRDFKRPSRNVLTNMTKHKATLTAAQDKKTLTPADIYTLTR